MERVGFVLLGIKFGGGTSSHYSQLRLLLMSEVGARRYGGLWVFQELPLQRYWTAAAEGWSEAVLCLVTQSCPTLGNPHRMYPARLLSCPWGFSRREYWSGFAMPPPGDLPNPGIEPRSHALWVDSLPSEPLGKPRVRLDSSNFWQQLLCMAPNLAKRQWESVTSQLCWHIPPGGATTGAAPAFLPNRKIPNLSTARPSTLSKRLPRDVAHSYLR